MRPRRSYAEHSRHRNIATAFISPPQPDTPVGVSRSGWNVSPNVIDLVLHVGFHPSSWLDIGACGCLTHIFFFPSVLGSWICPHPESWCPGELEVSVPSRKPNADRAYNVLRTTIRLKSQRERVCDTQLQLIGKHNPWRIQNSARRSLDDRWRHPRSNHVLLDGILANPSPYVEPISFYTYPCRRCTLPHLPLVKGETP